MPSAQLRDEVTDADAVDRMMTGRYVRLRQYIRGYYGREILGYLWQLAEADGATTQILYSRLSLQRPDTPVDTRGDLVDFVSYLSGDDKLIVLVEERATGEIAGFFWLADMVPKHRATVNLFFRKHCRGKLAFEASKLFREYATQVLGFRYLWGMTPWKHSIMLGRWCGMKQVAVLPHFQLIDGEEKDVYVVCYTRD